MLFEVSPNLSMRSATSDSSSGASETSCSSCCIGCSWFSASVGFMSGIVVVSLTSFVPRLSEVLLERAREVAHVHRVQIALFGVTHLLPAHGVATALVGEQIVHVRREHEAARQREAHAQVPLDDRQVVHAQVVGALRAPF